MSISSIRSASALAFVSVTATSVPARAHHAMDGATPSTFVEGVLSGLAHPVIGVDHLLAITALGVLAARLTSGAAIALLFVLATALGTAVHLLEIGLPAVELIIPLSVALFGAMTALRNSAPQRGWLGAAAILGGVAHGYAYGESIVGAEASPLGGYLLGFTIVQLAIVLAVSRAATLLVAHSDEVTAKRALQASGTVVAMAGFAMLVVAAV